MNMAFCVTGIGTGFRKTLASATLAEAIETYYGKPVQPVSDDDTDAFMAGEEEIAA